jgi:hypothetical protein
MIEPFQSLFLGKTKEISEILERVFFRPIGRNRDFISGPLANPFGPLILFIFFFIVGHN